MQSVDKNDPTHNVFTYKDGRSESWHQQPAENGRQVWTPDAVRPMPDPNNPSGPPIGMRETVDPTTRARAFDFNLSSGIAGDTNNVRGSFPGTTDTVSGHDRLANPADMATLQRGVQTQFCNQQRKLSALANLPDSTATIAERNNIVEQQTRNVQAMAQARGITPTAMRAELVAGCRAAAGGAAGGATALATGNAGGGPSRAAPVALHLLEDEEESCSASPDDTPAPGDPSDGTTNPPAVPSGTSTDGPAPATGTEPTPAATPSGGEGEMTQTGGVPPAEEKPVTPPTPPKSPEVSDQE